jgi:hypothetical protein
MAQKQAVIQDAVAKIIARAWSDPEFKDRLKRSPVSVFVDYGVEVSESKTLVVVEDTEDTLYLYIPPAPVDDELSIMQFSGPAKTAEGGGGSSSSGQCCNCIRPGSGGVGGGGPKPSGGGKKIPK